MGSLLTWISDNEPIHDINFEIVIQYNTLTSSYFIGPERLNCNKDFLIKQDKHLDKINSRFKDKILIICFEVIELYDVKKPDIVTDNIPHKTNHSNSMPM